MKLPVLITYYFLSCTVGQDASPGQRTCPDGWVSGDNSCYLFSTTLTTFSQASVFCRRQASHLVVFDSLDEYLFLTDTITKNKALNTTTYFLGFSGRMMGKYNLVTEAMYNVSFLFPQLKDYIDAYTGDKISGSTGMLDQSVGFNISFLKYTKSGEGKYVPKAGYICEKEKSCFTVTEKGVCLCAKWNEPIIRDFDGRSISLLPSCRYTLFNVAVKYKVDVVLKHQSTDGSSQTEQDIRMVYGRQISYLELTINNQSSYVMKFGQRSPQFRKLGTTADFSTGSFSDDLISFTKGTSYLDTFMSSEVPFILQTNDGNLRLTMIDVANFELSVKYPVASDQNVEGVCGKCSNDIQPDPAKFTGKNNTEFKIPLLYAQSWMDESRKCIGNMPKPASCMSATLFQKSVERCNHLQSTASRLNKDGCVSALVAYFANQRVSLYTACVSSVCEFGPKAACYYFTKGLQFCGYKRTEITTMFQKNEELDCDEQALCVVAKSDPTFSFNEETVWNGTCYMMNRQEDKTVSALNGFRAEGFCQQNLFHLSAIDSPAEQIHVINYFAIGHRYGKNGTDKAFWLGRTSEDQFKKQGTFDSRDIWFQPPELVQNNAKGKCTYMRGTKTNPGWDTSVCSDGIPGALCMFRSYVLCNSRPCFHPYMCDATSGKCYDPCFDDGFIVAGQCYRV